MVVGGSRGENHMSGRLFFDPEDEESWFGLARLFRRCGKLWDPSAAEALSL